MARKPSKNLNGNNGSPNRSGGLQSKHDAGESKKEKISPVDAGLFYAL